jgi:hypothetical protein
VRLDHLLSKENAEAHFRKILRSAFSSGRYVV